jgi:hypothetical protein
VTLIVLTGSGFVVPASEVQATSATMALQQMARHRGDRRWTFREVRILVYSLEGSCCGEKH